MSPATHKAIATTALGTVKEVDLPTPTPGAGEVLVEVKFASLSPVDAYQVDDGFLLSEDSYPHVLGFSGAGVVHTVGEGVIELKEGDQVTAFTYGGSRTKPLQKYCIVPQALVAKVPENYDLAAAASMSNSYVTAMHTIFGTSCLRLPFPSDAKLPAASAPANADAPILVYGAGSSSGQHMVQVLKLAGYTNIVAVASERQHELLTTLGAKACVDYHSKDLAQLIEKKAGGRKVEIVLDCIGSKPFIEAYAPAIAEGSRIAILAPVKDGAQVYNGKSGYYVSEFPDWLNKALEKAEQVIPVYTFQNQSDPIGKDIFMPKVLPQLLKDGLIQPNALKLLSDETLPGSTVLERAEEGLSLLRGNKAAGRKIVVALSP